MEHDASKFGGTVRSVKPGDAAEIEQILGEWLRDGRTGALLTDEINHTLSAVRASVDGKTGRVYLVVELPGGRVAGVMGLTGKDIDAELFSDDDKPAELINAYVARDLQGKGVGTALADELEKVAMKAGYTKLLVVSGSRNRDTGYAFWTSRYGEPVRFEKDFYGGGEERVVWVKALVSR